MEEEKAVGESSRASSSFVKAGDRQMFTVELRPGETTIVSWKKLLKDANKVNGSASTSAPDPPADARPALESRLAPVSPFHLIHSHTRVYVIMICLAVG
jgi:hypothetical protein